MGKFGDKFGLMTEQIKPSGEPRKSSASKAAPIAFGELVTARDQALDRAEAAEAKVAELETALKAGQIAVSSSDTPSDELRQLQADHQALLADVEKAQLAAATAREEAERLRLEFESKTADQVAALEEELRKAKEAGGSLEIPLDRLVEVEGRRRKLTDQEYADLRDNLAHNELASPITVRPREDGMYEIVSGHNRAAIFRELGRSTIQAWPRDVSDDQAEDMAFFANAMAAKLPDYAKYLGYKRFMEKHPDIEQQKLASRAGISDAQLTRLLKFDSLPTDAHAILESNPWLIGATMAHSLAMLVQKGHAAHVVDGLRKLAAGELKTEAQALAHATKASKPATPTPTASAPVTHKLGKGIYAKQRLLKKTLRVDFASEEEAAAVNAALKEVIERRIAALKAKE